MEKSLEGNDSNRAPDRNKITLYGQNNHPIVSFPDYDEFTQEESQIPVLALLFVGWLTVNDSLRCSWTSQRQLLSRQVLFCATCTSSPQAWPNSGRPAGRHMALSDFLFLWVNIQLSHFSVFRVAMFVKSDRLKRTSQKWTWLSDCFWIQIHLFQDCLHLSIPQADKGPWLTTQLAHITKKSRCFRLVNTLVRIKKNPARTH